MNALEMPNHTYFMLVHFFQIITIRDYIPKIVGSSAFHQYLGNYQGYDENTDPSISNVFSTAAFRFGHATIPPIVHRLNTQYREHQLYPNLLLSEVFFRPWRIINEGNNELIQVNDKESLLIIPYFTRCMLCFTLK